MMERQIILQQIKAAREKKFINNFYSMESLDNVCDIWLINENFAYSYEDHGIFRLIFFSKDWNSLNQLLKEIKHGKFFIEFMTATPEKCNLLDCQIIARMMRLSNADCLSVFSNGSLIANYKNSARVELAEEKDSKEINDILWSTFHTEISHLLSDDEIRDKIIEGQFYIHRNENKVIDSILQADVMPKKFYINQVINKADKSVIHAILLNRLEDYIRSGGKYLYAWVEEKNLASLKFHQKYGMKHDGMWSIIYLLER